MPGRNRDQRIVVRQLERGASTPTKTVLGTTAELNQHRSSVSPGPTFPSPPPLPLFPTPPRAPFIGSRPLPPCACCAPSPAPARTVTAPKHPLTDPTPPPPLASPAARDDVQDEITAHLRVDVKPWKTSKRDRYGNWSEPHWPATPRGGRNADTTRAGAGAWVSRRFVSERAEEARDARGAADRDAEREWEREAAGWGAAAQEGKRGKVEVHILDIAKVAKPRARSKRFEVVGAVKKVIALEDEIMSAAKSEAGWEDELEYADFKSDAGWTDDLEDWQSEGWEELGEELAPRRKAHTMSYAAALLQSAG
ncbi:uncharacterized protein BXZ73DRAFT_103355 [Epithele typhae]|uniref:uncharacterized protein n=1 Tax=Epithele typhae TaxID=378194 RepID=UPI002007BFAF|nr:uncharacterized protein BXZ73DRAFT_103355 [Epithele typhae]KAH9924978.1 hypothetical protein BXZ73DRAFT_103355 [Epithele typhae]